MDRGYRWEAGVRRSVYVIGVSVGLIVFLVAMGVIPALAQSPLGAPDNPVPVGKPILMASGQVQEYLVVAEVWRGAEAWARISRYSALNKPPAEGKEYLMALVVMRVVSGPAAETSLCFKAISNGQESTEAANVVYVRPEFLIDTTPDTMSGGWIVREIDPSDPNPLLAVSFRNDPDRVLYFAMTPDN
jgi:hypothetical protein